MIRMSPAGDQAGASVAEHVGVDRERAVRRDADEVRRQQIGGAVRMHVSASEPSVSAPRRYTSKSHPTRIFMAQTPGARAAAGNAIVAFLFQPIRERAVPLPRLVKRRDVIDWAPEKRQRKGLLIPASNAGT